MVDISAILKTTKNAIENRDVPQTERDKYSNRLGMGSIGKKCSRQLQYSFHNCAIKPPIPAKLSRLFEFGTLAEDILVRMLEEVGIEVTDRQKGMEGFGGHVYGYIDGIAHGVIEAPKTPHLLEFKTHNDRNFKILSKKGVRGGFVEHYGQCQRYMHGLDLTRALYVGYNKNTSEIYVERIRYSKSFAEDLVRKETNIVISSDLDPRLGEGDKYLCTFCNYREVCFSGAPVDKNCRTCAHVDRKIGGIWLCNHHNIDKLEKSKQNEGCSSWTIKKMFISDII